MSCPARLIRDRLGLPDRSPSSSHPPVPSFGTEDAERRGDEIKDQVAVTKLRQVFYNPSDRRMEGTFLFPVPKGARIDKFSMEVNGKMQKAELLDSARKRKIYEDIVRKALDPALSNTPARASSR